MTKATSKTLILGAAISLFGAAASISIAYADTPVLNQYNVTLGLGQSASVYSQASSTAVYMASNSNPNVASIQTNGSQVTVTGEQPGATTGSICYAGTGSDCTNLNITVQTGSVLGFSQNNLTLAIGGNTTVAVSGGSGNYSVSGNSNPSDISAVLTGSTITVTGTAAGSANITVCDNSGNCGTLYATAGSTTANGSLSFDNTNPSIAVGQVIITNVSGGSGYYVTGNSNPNVASQSVNNNSLTISGLASGSTAITVCSASNGCGTVNVTVGGTTTGGQVSFGMTNPTLAVGQNLNISLSGGGSYYVSSNPNSNIVQAGVNGNTLNLYGENAGSDSLTVCTSGGGCNALYITVSGQPTPIQNTTVPAPASSLLAAIQSMQGELTQIVAQIQSMETALAQFAGSAAANTGTNSNPNTSTAAPSAAPYAFTQFLGVGSRGADVTALQEYLAKKGYYSGSITGFYGSLTETAVKAYQVARGVNPTGYVGPGTRAALNAGE